MEDPRLLVEVVDESQGEVSQVSGVEGHVHRVPLLEDAAVRMAWNTTASYHDKVTSDTGNG